MHEPHSDCHERTTPTAFSLAKASLRFVVWTCLFSLAYTQAPLYYSNQNQYFLHGLAAADHGVLKDDWLASTADPTPVFSLLVALTARHLPAYAFHLYYAILLGIYWVSMLSVFAHLAGDRCTPRLRLAFAALLLLFHAAVVRWASYRVLNGDYACYFQGWLAAQYVLGAVFQPSAFGVLLVAAIALYLRDQPFAAVASAALGATVHATYLLGAGVLTLAFLFALWRDGKRQQALWLGVWALALVAPVVVYGLVTFQPTSPDAFAEAQRILVYVRIPHHCVPALWCDGITVGQIAWMLLSLFLARGTRLFPVIGIVFSLSLALSLVQWATDNDTLALLFPWRTSVILIPLATAVIVARVVLVCAGWFNRPAVGVASGIVVMGLVLGGCAILVFKQGFQTNDDELPLLDYIRDNQTKGDVYLLPVQVPKLTSRGSLSSDFRPLPGKSADKRIIPFDFQRFRLHAGAPIYVDFKAIPYRDKDVLEWHRRALWNQKVYQERDWNKTGTLADLKREGITHVVATKDRDIRCDGLDLLYEDASYRVYRVR